MARLYAPRQAEPDAYTDSSLPPDPDQIVIDGLREWMHVNKHQLPPPCPTDFADCARWWREQVQEPEKRHETFMSASGGSQSARWDCGYAVRLRTTLLHFLGLQPQERSLILGAREDGIFWRGEPIEAFTGVIEETEAMRRVGVAEYRQQAIKRLKGVFEALNGGAA